MCYVAAIPYVVAAVGAGMSYYGQQQQAEEFKRARNEQDAYATAQRQLALNQKGEEQKFGEQKNKAIMEEAEAVAPTRLEHVQQAEDKQTASNVNALQQANVLGGDSVAAGAQGNQSNAYLKARAEAAAKQTDQAIKLARLFGATGAGNTAVANQAQNALDFRLDQQAIDANRRSMQRGYDWMFDDLSVRRAKAQNNYNPNKGAGWQALGGLAMNYGADGIGTSMGNAAGSGAAAGNYFMNLNNSRVG